MTLCVCVSSLFDLSCYEDYDSKCHLTQGSPSILVLAACCSFSISFNFIKLGNSTWNQWPEYKIQTIDSKTPPSLSLFVCVCVCVCVCVSVCACVYVCVCVCV